jgi:hypothetical protein
VDRVGPVHHGPVAIAALGSSPELGLRPLRCPRAPTEGWGRGRFTGGELNDGVATTREAVEGRLAGGELNGGVAVYASYIRIAISKKRNHLDLWRMIKECCGTKEGSMCLTSKS